MRTGSGTGWKNRRRVTTLDPAVYQKDRAGFVRALRAIHEAAQLGCDTSGSYLIVEGDRVVGIGGCDAHAAGGFSKRPIRSFR